MPLLRMHNMFHMNQLLYSYLLQHRSLSLPGLGTIYVEYLSAQSDFPNHRFLPPAFYFRFDKYFDAPDKDFFSFLAKQKQLADYEAIRLYNEWAYELRNRLRTEESIPLDGIGVLKKDSAGEIVLDEIQPIPIYLQPVDAHRVVRKNAIHTMLVGDRETTTERMHEFFEERHPIPRRGWKLYALVAFIVSLLVLLIHFITNGFNIASTGSR